MEHETKHHLKKSKKANNDSIWKIISGILFLLLIVSIFINVFGRTKEESNTLSAQEASEKAIDFINNNLVQPGTSAKLKDVKELNKLYKIKIDIQGEDFDSYITKDGSLLFPSVIDLSEDIVREPTQIAQPTQQRQAVPNTPPIDMVTLIDDDEVKGSADAPVTIVEFSDFECPFCTRFYTQTLPQIEEQYIKTGNVKFVYRDFPLGFHANAQKAAEAAECAAEQGKFWEMHDKLFEEGVEGSVSSFKRFAADLGLDTTKFNDCLDSGKMESEVKKDMADGSAMGISGTPGFIINGQLVSGAQPFEVFKQIIDGELAK